jgi:membrane protein DedA with SNARE-associated domain
MERATIATTVHAMLGDFLATNLSTLVLAAEHAGPLLAQAAEGAGPSGLEGGSGLERLATSLMEHMPYLGVVVVLVLTGIGLPLPEDVPLLVAGVLCAKGYADVRLMIVFATFFTVFADCILYGLGRRYGHHLPNVPLLRRFLTQKNLAKAEEAFSRHCGKALFLSRFMPGIRGTFYVSAGMFRVPLWKMVLYDGGAAIVSVPLWVLAAYYFTRHGMLDRLRAFASGMQLGMLLVLGVTLAVLVILHQRSKRARARAAALAVAADPLPSLPDANEAPRAEVMTQAPPGG